MDGGLNVRGTPTLQRFRTVAGCHGNLGRIVTLPACGEFARKEFSSQGIFDERHHLCGWIDRHRHGDPVFHRPAVAWPTPSSPRPGLHGATAQPHLPGHYLTGAPSLPARSAPRRFSLVLFTFGFGDRAECRLAVAGVGLSATVALIIAAIWAALVQVIGFASGGYVAGRVRNSWGSVVPHERRFRDGMHGLIVWAVGLLIGAAFAASAAGNVLRAGTQATAAVAAGAAASAASTGGACRLRLRLSHAATDASGCGRRAAAGR